MHTVLFALVVGFIASTATWCAWFVTHLPWLGLPERVSIPLLIVTWLVALTMPLRGVPRVRSLGIGALAGLASGMIGLLLLGSKLVEPPPEGTGPAGAVIPAAPLIVIGFLTLGVALGVLAGLIASCLPPRRAPTSAASGRLAPLDAAHLRPSSRDLLAWFAWVMLGTLAPLILIGGLVTSTDAGMAVPDWPGTFGSNMFLYPLGPRARPEVFLEHSHRLFGTLAGLAAIVLAGWTLATDLRRSARVLAVAVLTLVVLQGVLGGLRVLTGSPDPHADPRLLRFVHGVLAQVTVAVAAALAAVLSPMYQALPPGGDPSWRDAPPGAWRRARFWSTALLHASFLQLVLGAMYRHFRDSHSLWTHAGFAVIVTVAAASAAFAARAASAHAPAAGQTLRRTAGWILAVVILQVVLGWATLLGGGTARAAESVPQALLRTAHQGTGALLIALGTVLYVFLIRLVPHRRALSPPLPPDSPA